MKILFLGLDYTLCQDGRDVMADSRQREEFISRRLNGYDIVILTPPRTGLARTVQRDGLTVWATHSASVLGMVRDACAIGEDICRRHGIDVITTQDPFLTGLAGCHLKRRCGVPLNVQIHGDCLDNPRWLKESPANYFYNQLGKFVLKRADSVMTVHPQLTERIGRILSSGHPAITSLPAGLGIDPGPFRDLPRARGEEKRRQWLGSRFDRLVFFAGRLTRQKNIDLLLEAVPRVLARHPGTLFVIAGDGDQRRRLTGRDLGDFGANVSWAGTVPYDEMPACYAASDVVVLPSRYEGLARISMEAGVSGTPIVTTDVTGAYDVVTNGENGFLVPDPQADTFAEAIIRVLDRPQMFRDRAVQLRGRFAEQFDRGRAAEAMIKIWENTVSKKQVI